jgi:hypothetical protein
MRRYLNRALAFASMSLITAAWLLVACVSACAQTQASVTLSAGVVTISSIGLTTAAGNPVVLSQPDVTTNLLTLSNEAATLLQGSVMPPGTYTDLDFTFSGGYIQLQNGLIYATSPTYAGLPPGATVNGTLKLPKALKIVAPGGSVTVSANSKLLLIDFDVSQSSGHLAGGSGSWVYGQSIQATSLILSGNIVVTVSADPSVTFPIVNGTQITLTDFDAEITISGGTTKTVPLQATADPTVFSVSFIFLLPGSFNLTLVAPVGVSFTTSPTVPIPVTVLGGQETDVALVVTSVTLP